MRKILCGLSLVMLSTWAQAQIPTTDIASLIQRIVMIATEYSQEAELIEQVVQTYNVVEQATNTAKSLQLQLDSALNVDQVHSITDVLVKVKQANALSNNVNGIAQQFDAGFASTATFQTSHDALTASTRQAVINNASTLDNLPNDAQRLNRLVDQSNAAGGALQAQAQNAESGLRARSEKAQAEITREFFGGKMQ